MPAAVPAGRQGRQASTIGRLKAAWQAEYADFQTKDWRGHEMVYLWADGVYINVRAAERRCVLVLTILGASPARRRELAAVGCEVLDAGES